MSLPEAPRAEAQAALEAWGCPLSDGQWRLLGAFLEDVLEYNKKANLTAAKDLEELLFRHALDGLAAVQPLRALVRARTSLEPHMLQGRREAEQRPPPLFVEVGAGAGFVGVSVKIAWPEARVRLVESSYKRFCFLNWTSSRLRLKGFELVHATAGKSPAKADGDVVLARALAPLPEALGLTLPLARPGGAALIYQSDPPSPGDPALTRALASTGGRLESVFPYRLPREVRQRHMAVFRRSGCTG